ncbi:MAG: ADP-ribosylglycohydrolase family protein [Oscillospiraceae bacterium]|nr:ADP-ribosylglycohydrolase family protein [Oscillospiraceae bacterium]
MSYIHIANMAPGIQFDVELLQAHDEGCDLSSLQSDIALWKTLQNDEKKRHFAAKLQEKIRHLPQISGYPYIEPSDYEDILAARPTPSPYLDATPPLNNQKLLDKIYGAWLARCAGTMLGQPMEGWMRPRILGFLQATGNYPVKAYCRSDIDEQLRRQFDVQDIPGPYGMNKQSWRNNVTCMPQDDDTNFTIFALNALETHGKDITSAQILHLWLHRFPLGYLWTAERVAYRNAVLCIEPPESAMYCNPYREWIGAQIRADLYGYVSPGNPQEAARLAYVDARISHIKNGIYGAMWVAAMLAQAAVDSDIKRIVTAGMAQIPARSRLYEALQAVLSWHDDGIDAETAITRIHERYDETLQHHWCHTISNAMIVSCSLLWGALDMDKTMHIGLTAAFDTDCNCATAGSVLGMIVGARTLPQKWIEPFNDTIMSCIGGEGMYKISELAQRCAALV